MAKRAKFKIMKSKYEFLCQGLVRCIRCGRAYGGKIQRDTEMYRCSQAHGLDFNSPRCRSRSMSRRKLDTVVWDYVKNLISNKDKIKENIHILRNKRESERGYNENICNNLLKEKDKLKIKKGKLLDLYSDNDFEKEDLKLKINELNEKEQAIDSQISEIKSKLKNTENIDDMEREIEKICQLYRQKIDNPPFELKKYIVKKWIEEINIQDDGTIIIKVRIPQGETAQTEAKELLYMPNWDLTGEMRFQEVLNP